MNSAYQICRQCIMDTSDPEITFNDGICCHCHNYRKNLAGRVFSGTEADQRLNTLLQSIKKKGKHRQYDCLIGVSGGVDSTYIAYLCKKMGLRPLALHFDNGWNSELAVSNIEKVLKKLGIDLITFVMDWEEFRDLQRSFLYASTPDGEIPTDHAIYAVLMKTACQHHIRYVITGMNYKTESILPRSWSYGHSDWRYIKHIQQRFGRQKLQTYPHYSLKYLFYIQFMKRLKFISLLNYIDYQKDEAMQILENELGWKYYGSKHYESIYTRFYQGYILPKKFNIDKRRAHLSNLINSGQKTRDEALAEMHQDPYAPSLQSTDRDFVIKKLQLTETEFEKIMKLPQKQYSDYPNNAHYIGWVKNLINFLRRQGIIPK